MKRFSIPVLAAVFLLAVPPARALTFLELATGDDALFPDARSVAMGRTRLAEGAGAFTGTVSPARLAWAGDPRVSIGGGVQKLKETRSIPAFDSFDGFLVESIYVLNDRYQYRGGIGATASAPEEWGLGALGLGISWAPVRDFQYDYSEEVRDNNPFTQPRDQLIALNEVQSDGTLDAFTVGVGWAPVEWVSVGGSVQILRGEQDLLHRTMFEQLDSTAVSSLHSTDLSGTRGIFGLSVAPNERVDATVTFRTETTLSGDLLQVGDPAATAYFAAPAAPGGTMEITYPLEVGVGLAYHPRARVKTVVQADVTWTEWSQFRHGLWDGLDLMDVWNLRFGIEHTFYNGFPVRFGFHYQPSPENDEVATTSFTFGGGLDLGPLRGDLGFEISNRDYRFPDLFDDAMFGGNTRTEKDLVDESALTVYGTVSYDLPKLGG